DSRREGAASGKSADAYPRLRARRRSRHPLRERPGQTRHFRVQSPRRTEAREPAAAGRRIVSLCALDEAAAGHDLDGMQTFADLVASRKSWLTEVLAPWCALAGVKDLKRAELEWVDIAGKVDPEKTLWFWAWSRFPNLVNADLAAIDEARKVTVVLRDGR